MAESPLLPKRYVLDACALIAFFNDEDGADKAEVLIERAQAGEVELLANSINLVTTQVRRTFSRVVYDNFVTRKCVAPLGLSSYPIFMKCTMMRFDIVRRRKPRSY